MQLLEVLELLEAVFAALPGTPTMLRRWPGLFGPSAATQPTIPRMSTTAPSQSMDQPRRLSFCALAGAWTPPELSTDEFRNQERALGLISLSLVPSV